MNASNSSKSKTSLVHKVSDAQVVGIVSACPTELIKNETLASKFGSRAIHDIQRITGVQTRYIAAKGQTAADLCTSAAEKLLSKIGWESASVDAVIFVSQTPDHVMPASACIIQSRLNLPNKTAAFDVNQGCSGYVYGLWLAFTLCNAGLNRVLLLAGDTISHLVDQNDRATALLFGDAGSATAISRKIDEPTSTFLLGTDGLGAKNLIVEYGARYEGMQPLKDLKLLKMNGAEVFSFTLRAIPQLINDTLIAANIGIEAIDYFLLHQANKFMLEAIRKKVGILQENFPINIERYGNTSSASIPLLITSEIAAAISTRHMHLMLVGFGVGFSWGAADVRLQKDVYMETIYA